MKRSLKFLTLSFLILLAQSSLAESYVEGTGSVGHSQEVVAVGISYTDENGVEYKNEAGNPKPEEATKEYYATAVGIANKASGKYSSAIGYRNKASGKYSSAIGFENTASGEGSSTIGFYNKVSGNYSSAIGYWNEASGGESSAIGYRNKASVLGSSAIGYWNEASGNYSSAFGFYNKVSGRFSSAFGSETYVIGEDSGAFGRGKWDRSLNGGAGDYIYKIEGKNSWAIGSFNSIAKDSDNNHILGNNVSIGNASTAITDVVVLGNESTVEESQVVSIGSATKKRKIVHLAAGTNDTDAVNKKQMEDAIASASLGGVDLSSYTKKDASNLSTADITIWKSKLAVASVSGIANTATGADSTGLGHGNEVTGNKSTAVGYKNNVSGNNSGAFGDPNTVSGNRSYAFGNDNTIKGDDNFVMGSNVNIGAGITNSVALGNNSAVSSSNEVSVGSATLKRKITNVADGEVSATSTDAVTGKQLYNVMQNSGTVGIQNLRKEVRDAKDEMRGIGSLSAALSALHPMQYDPQAPNQIMAGVGTYRNKHAIAVGLTHYFKENVMMTAGVSLSNERKTNAMANVGLTWKIGKGGSSSATNAPQYIV